VKITVESTELLVTLELYGIEVPARIWRGQTADGVPCMAYITRIAPMDAAGAEAFERELIDCGTGMGPHPEAIADAKIVEEP